MPTSSSHSAKTRQKWSQALVISRIRSRHLNGWALNVQVLARDDSSLLAAGRRYFGSWQNALDAAGFTPPSSRLAGVRHGRGYWSRERILAEIENAAGHGYALHAHAMQRTNNRLVSAATYYFGSWAEALRQAGFDADAIRAVRRHSTDSIIADIQQLLAQNADVRDCSMRRDHRSLYWAAQKYFGSWRQALCAAQTHAAKTETPILNLIIAPLSSHQAVGRRDDTINPLPVSTPSQSSS